MGSDRIVFIAPSTGEDDELIVQYTVTETGRAGYWAVTGQFLLLLRQKEMLD
jgi:hypothetical protein